LAAARDARARIEILEGEDLVETFSHFEVEVTQLFIGLASDLELYPRYLGPQSIS
jgi:hypothetical protein